MQLITIKTFVYPTEAYVLQSKLESEGIECHIFDDNTVQMNPLYSQSVGGVKLKVEEKYLEQVNAIMAEIDSNLFLDDKGNTVQCPKCESTNLNGNLHDLGTKKGIGTLLVVLFFAILPFFEGKHFQCKSCNHKFLPDESDH